MENNSNHSGLDFADCLLLLFIALKLTGCINWSWFWVLSPLWISIIIAIIVAIIVAIIN